MLESPARAAALDAAAKLMQEAFNAGEGSWRDLAGIAFDLTPDPDPIGRVEVADVLGVHRNNLNRNHPDLPEPEWRRKMGPLWRRETIENYKAAQAAGVE